MDWIDIALAALASALIVALYRYLMKPSERQESLLTEEQWSAPTRQKPKQMKSRSRKK